MVTHGDFQPWQGITELTMWLFKSLNCRRSGSYSMCCSLTANLHAAEQCVFPAPLSVTQRTQKNYYRDRAWLIGINGFHSFCRLVRKSNEIKAEGLRCDPHCAPWCSERTVILRDVIWESSGRTELSGCQK